MRQATIRESYIASPADVKWLSFEKKYFAKSLRIFIYDQLNSGTVLRTVCTVKYVKLNLDLDLST